MSSGAEHEITRRVSSARGALDDSAGADGAAPAYSEKISAHLAAFHDQLIAGQTPPRLAAPDLDPVDLAQVTQLESCLLALDRLRPILRRDIPTVDALHQRVRSFTPAAGLGLTIDEPAPSRIARFTIEERLGGGGQGIVFRARDPDLDRPVAIKLPRPEILVSPSARARFLDEARLAARLSHPHLARVYEVGESGPVCYIASEFCDGPDLAEWLAAQQSLPDIRQAAELVRQLATAVSAMHACEVLHRDLKPSNVLLARTRPNDDAFTSELSSFVPKITDFGLARLLADDSCRTHTGALLGTPAYMSPEQARGMRGDIGPTTDVYSLGVILFELLAGRPPYRGESDVETLTKLLDGNLPSLRKLRPAVPRDLAAICSRALDRDPAARYFSAAALADDLKRWLDGEPTQARSLSTLQMAIRWGRRKPAQAALVGVSLLALVTIAAGSSYSNFKLNAALSLAEGSRDVARSYQHFTKFENDRLQGELYGARMRLAGLALESGDPARARELLEIYRDEMPNAQLRHIDWYIHKQRLDEVEHLAVPRGGNTTTAIGEHLPTHWGNLPPRAHPRYWTLPQPDREGLLFGYCDELCIADFERHGYRSLEAPSQVLKANAVPESMDLSFSSEGKYAQTTGTTTLTEVETGQLRPFLPELNGNLSVAVYDHANTIVSIDRSGILRVHDSNTLKESQRIVLPNPDSQRMYMPRALSRDGRTLLISRKDEPILFLNLSTQALRKSDIPHAAQRVWFALNGARVYSLMERSFDSREIHTGNLLASLKLDGSHGVAALSDDQQVLALVSNDRLTLWDVHARQETLSASVPPMLGANLAFSGDGKRLQYSGFRDDKYYVYEWPKPAKP